ncbi:MAG TPA: protein kinase [Polyangia bacterium]|nr:protein kinase [Polyangia bacterium]
MPDRYPKRFGKYILLKPLARGGMGEIYVAVSGEIDGFEKLCVIKKVLPEKADKGKANRFLDEAKVVLKLSHGNLVVTFDAGDVDGEFFIAMELVEGKDLREIWNRCVRTRTRIPLDVALHVTREVARALSYVHTYGDLHLVHRDVAPPNILLSYFGQAKLTDFGLARSVLKQEHTNPGVVFGRASYLAPEQARGEVADARSDIYSLGIVLWELLTGQQYMQLSDLDPATALSLVRHPRAEPPSRKAPWLSPELDALVIKALAPEREQRFQTAEEMRQALSDVIIRVAPQADAERASEFLRGLYGGLIKEERDERERLLKARQKMIVDPPPLLPAVLPPASGEVVVGTGTGGESGDLVGRVIENRYRILRKIGEGGMGTIYAGEHVEIRKGVAIKILHPVYSKQQNLVERFRREARAASRIGHPNIIDVTDFGTTEDGCAYFVMEHLDGIDLADVLSHERRIDPLRAVRIGMQICSALHAAHNAGVIHRDLKPENIYLVARDGEADFVKVLDFGIARSVSRRSRRLTNPGMAMGTPEYMAPEQALASTSGDGGNVDRRSDIYSVGALLYEMISGAPPHQGVTYQDILAQRAKALPEPLRSAQPELPEELDRTILRALEPEPAMRFQTMAQLQYELTKIVWGRPRAVAELLNMREPNARIETPMGLRNRWADANATVERRFEEFVPDGDLARQDTPATAPMTLVPPPVERRASPVPPLLLSPELPAPNDAAVSGVGSLAQLGVRTVGTMAILSLGVAVTLGVYHKFPWSPSVGAGAAASVRAAPGAAAKPYAVDSGAARAARLQALNNEAELRIANGLAPVSAPGLLAVLTEIRRLGGAATADRMAAAASNLLQQRAETALDQGDVEGGIELYRSALSLDPAAQGASLLARALLDRGRRALAARHPAEAVRWGRKALSYAEADPGAHAFLADAFFAAREYNAAAEEYTKALSSRPADPTLRRGLARSRAKLAAVHPRSTAAVAPGGGGAGGGEGAAAFGDPPPGAADAQVATARTRSAALSVSSAPDREVGPGAAAVPAARESAPAPPPPRAPAAASAAREAASK